MSLDDTTRFPNTQVPRLRVLVVDDEPGIRTIARLMLERAGYVVEEAATAAEAIRVAATAECPFAVVLIDVSLPDRSGIEALPDLRLITARSRIVLTSGRSEEDHPDHGADGYLPKPFSLDQLLAMVRAVTALTPR